MRKRQPQRTPRSTPFRAARKASARERAPSRRPALPQRGESASSRSDQPITDEQMRSLVSMIHAVQNLVYLAQSVERNRSHTVQMLRMTRGQDPQREPDIFGEFNQPHLLSRGPVEESADRILEHTNRILHWFNIDGRPVQSAYQSYVEMMENYYIEFVPLLNTKLSVLLANVAHAEVSARRAFSNSERQSLLPRIDFRTIGNQASNI